MRIRATLVFLALTTLGAIILLVQETPRHSAVEIESIGDQQVTGVDGIVDDHADDKKSPTTVQLSNQEALVFADVVDYLYYQEAIQKFTEFHPVGEFRIVEFNSNQFRELIRNANGAAGFELRLLDDGPIRVVAEAAGESHSGWQSGFASWIGRVGNEKLSSVQFLASPDGTIDGLIFSPSTGRIKIDAVPDTPYHIIWGLEEGIRQRLD